MKNRRNNILIYLFSCLSRTSRHFVKDKKGSVIIEFFFMILLLLMMFAFMADLVLIRTTQGKLDNATYSLVNVLRERSLLYNQRQELNADDAKQIKQLAAVLLYGDKNRENDVKITVEFWREGTGNNYLQLGDTSNCSPYIPLTGQNMQKLAPLSDDDAAKKIPTYQVTACVESSSLFKGLLLDSSSRLNDQIRSSSWSVGL